MTTEKALLPCPFCGGEAEFEREGTSRHSCIVVCTNCGARHESGDQDGRSGSSWNRRAALSLPETQGECDELNDRNIQQRALIEDLAAMCRRMSYALARQGTNDTTVKQCVALLKKHDLGGSVVREMAPPSQPAQGGRLVPVEPTPEMWDAAWNSIVLPYRAKLSMHEIKTLFDLFHKAMLAAAPAAPTNGEGA